MRCNITDRLPRVDHYNFAYWQKVLSTPARTNVKKYSKKEMRPPKLTNLAVASARDVGVVVVVSQTFWGLKRLNHAHKYTSFTRWEHTSRGLYLSIHTHTHTLSKLLSFFLEVTSSKTRRSPSVNWTRCILSRCILNNQCEKNAFSNTRATTCRRESRHKSLFRRIPDKEERAAFCAQFLLNPPPSPPPPPLPISCRRFAARKLFTGCNVGRLCEQQTQRPRVAAHVY